MSVKVHFPRLYPPRLVQKLRSNSGLIVLVLLLITSLYVISAAAYRMHRHSVLAGSGAAVGYRYHQLENNWLGMAVVRRNERRQFEAQCHYSGGLSFLNSPAFSDPVLIDIPSSGVGAFAEIRSCKTLHQFSCSRTTEVPALDFRQLPIAGSLSSLRVIFIGTDEPEGAQTTLQTVARCDLLEVLWIPRYNCSDEDINVLRTLENLRVISMSGPGITDMSLEYLEEMPRLEAVFFGDNVSISQDLLHEWTTRTGVVIFIGPRPFGGRK